MPTVTDALVEGFSRTPDLVARALDGQSAADLAHRIDPDANTIAWLVWHTARMQDGQVSRARRTLGDEGADQVWTSQGYAERFGLDIGEDEIGYGMSSEQVAKVQAPAELLRAYHQAVNDATIEWLQGLSDADYDTVVDKEWDPPVTLLSRLVSIEQDAVQHLGQAAYLRGVIERT